MAKVTIYGLATCDTTRAARKWLADNGIEAGFHDVRADGLTKAMIAGWVKGLGWEKVLNKASTTWRELPDAAKADVDEAKAAALLLEHPALVKRPLLEAGGKVSVGFKAADWAARLGK
jgi:arsenate reductase (glutaredoxin)